ncbi:MAG TPA: DUF1801 domain-containing protein [Blastocatellia bacterium]|nr:DUF1801 domain-containing protein [Blastocatellia bacterium]
MKASEKPPATIDEYISQFPSEIQEILEKIRKTIRKAAPRAEEAISYQIPTFKQNGNLVHFAAYKNHIGFYPAPRNDPKFKAELARYEGAKGTLKLPLDKPIPLALISKIVKFRVEKNIERAAARQKKR